MSKKENGTCTHSISLIFRYTCVLAMLGFYLPVSYAGPAGGEVVGGSGNISTSGVNTTINQTSQNMAINWQSFDLTANERVQFIQPNASSISLNRILSQNGSTIAGRIDANGQVILVNPNGIFFTPTSIINVGGIIASGLNIQPSDFMNGNFIFDEVLGTEGAVINSGMINASLGGSELSEGGNVALIGKRVENDGLIAANLGTVTLAAGKQAILTFDDSGMLGVRVSKKILQEELGVDPAVMNNGDIQAEGGQVLLTASISQDIFSQAVNTNSLETATSVVVHEDGSFTLGGGADVLNAGTINTSTVVAGNEFGRIVLIGENVTSSGSLTANAAMGNAGDIEVHARNTVLLSGDSMTAARAEENGLGGVIKVLGDSVGVFDQSIIDVSGDNGGGQALMGGDFQGLNSLIRNSTTTIVNGGTSIFSDAITDGNGGKVIIWSDGNTFFGGDVFVRGGMYSGNGGLVETSGKQNLWFRGNTDRTAANGEAGILLLDPRDITIGSSSGDNDELDDRTVDFDDNCDESACDDGDDDISISSGKLQSELNGGNVILRANRDIIIEGSITTSSGAVRTLTLEAGDDITTNVGSAFNLGNDNLVMVAGSTGCGGACQENNGVGNSLYGSNIRLQGTVDTSGSVILHAADSIWIDNAIGSTTAPSSIVVRAGNSIETRTNLTPNPDTFGTLTSNGGITLTAGDATLTSVSEPYRTVARSQSLAGNILLRQNVTTNDNLFTASTSAGYFSNNYSGQILDAGTGTVTINANGNDGTSGAILGKINAGVLNVTTTTGGIFQSNNSAQNFAVTGTATFNSGANTIDLQNGDNNLQGNIVFTNTGSNNIDLQNAATTTLLGTITTGGNLTVTAAEDLTLTNANPGGDDIVGAAGSVVQLSFGQGDSAGYTFTANGTATTGAGGSITVTGGTGGDTFTIVATGLSGFTLDGAAGVDILSAADENNFWLIDSANGGGLYASAANRLVPSNERLLFNRIENLTGTDNTSFADDYLLTSSGSLSGMLEGDLGANDVLVIQTTGTSVQLGSRTIEDAINNANLNVNGIETITADSGSISTNTLNADNVANTWTIGATTEVTTPANDVVFTNFGILTGGNAVDTFTISADFSGIINGDQVAGTGNDIFNINSVTGFSGTINGVGGADDFNIQQAMTGILNGDGGNDTFDLSANVAGSVNGGSGDDSFTILNDGIATTITGGADVDIITAFDSASTNSWNIDDADGGTLTNSAAIINFSGIENVYGGSGVDDFIITSTGNITGVLEGNGNLSDTLIIQTTGTSVQLGARTTAVAISDSSLNVNGVDTITSDPGSMSTNLLYAENNVNTWTIGTDLLVDGVTFVNFGVLTGGTAVDTFNITADFSGTINGGVEGTGVGTDDTSADVFNFQPGLASFTGTVNGRQGADNFNIQSAGILFSNTLSGGAGNDILTTANETNYWLIDSANGGTVFSDSARTITRVAFSNIENLTGNSGIDDFLIGVTGTIAQINGGTGAGTNTLTGRETANTWSINASSSLGLTSGGSYVSLFSNINSLNGGASIDTFDISAVFSGNVSGGGGNDIFNISASVGGGTLSGNAGDDTFNIQSTGLTIGLIDGGSLTETTGDKLIAANENNYWLINTVGGGAIFTSESNRTALTPISLGFNGIESITGNNANDNFLISGAGSLTSIDGGGAGINSLTGLNGANTWTIAGTNSVAVTSGSTYVNSFTNIDIVNGGSGVDTFNVNAGSTIGTLNGQVGNDVFTINGTVTSVNGGGGDDDFTVSGTVTGVIDGGIDSGAGVADKLTITVAGNQTVQLGGVATGTENFTVNNIETIDATNSATGNILRAGNGTNTWDILVSSNTVSGTAFTNFTRLVGGSGDDTFNVSTALTTINLGDGVTSTNTVIINAGGSVSGDITGGDGVDNVTVNTGGSAGVIRLFENNDSIVIASPGVISVSSIIDGGTNVSGSENDTLTVNTSGNTWALTNATDGTVTNSGNSVSFFGFESLNSAPGSTDSLDYSGVVGNVVVDLNTISGIDTIIGNYGEVGALTSSITAWDGTTNNWQIGLVTINATPTDGLNDGTVSNGTATVTFENFNTLIGGDGNDTFTITNGTGTGPTNGAFDGSMNGGSGGMNTLVARDVDNTWNINGASNLNYSVTISASLRPTVTTLSNIQQLIGGNSVDVFNIDTTVTSINGGDGNNVITIGASGRVTGALLTGTSDDIITINSGGSASSINAGNGNNIIVVNGSLTGVLVTGTDNDIVNISGSAASISTSSGDDQITVSGTVTGVIDGGTDVSDNDTLTINSASARTVQLGNSILNNGEDYTVTNFELIDASSASNIAGNVLRADTGTNSWMINTGTDNDGIINNINFSNFTHLEGNINRDVFIINASVGSISAGNGFNDITINAAGSVTGSITTGNGDDIVRVNGSANAISTAEGDDQISVSGSVSGVIDGGTNTNDFDLFSVSSTSVRTIQIGASVLGNGEDYTVTNIEMIDALAASNSAGNVLRADTGNNSWLINTGTDNDGQLNSTNFINIAHLEGNIDQDDFIINAGISSINAGDGINSVTVNGTGSISGTLFTGINNDTITINVGGNASTINAGDGVNDITINGSATNITTGINDDTIVINGSATSINAGNGLNIISITSTGSLLGALVTGVDDDQITVSGLVSGVIDGGSNVGDSDLLIINSTSPRIVQLGSSIVGNGEDYTVTNVEMINADNATNIAGNTLRADTGTNTWSIDTDNAGTVLNTGATVAFTNFAHLVGNIDNDDFTIDAVISSLNAGNGTNSVIVNGSVSGSLITGTGDDTININLGGIATTINVGDGSNNITVDGNAVMLTSGAGIDTITVTGTVAGLGTGNTIYTGDDNDTINISGTVTGVINGGVGTTDLLTLTSVGDQTVQLSATTVAGENYTVTNVETINATGTSGNVDGNTLMADTGPNTWMIDASNGGSVTDDLTAITTVFSNFANISGGSEADDFTINTIGGSLSGLINGMGGDDSLDITTLAGVTVQMGNAVSGNINVYQVEDISANSAYTNTLMGDSTVNPANPIDYNWSVTGINEGTVAYNGSTTVFSNFTNVYGGSAVDQFTVSTGSLNLINMGAGNDFFSISGGNIVTVDGNTGNDTFTLSGGNVTNMIGGDGTDFIVDTSPVVNITVGSDVGGFEGVTAQNGNGIINAQANVVSTWSITGTNAGSVSDDSGENLAFSGFSTINGGGGIDRFSITGNGSISSGINGNGGNDTLSIDLSETRTLSGQVSFDGGVVGNDVITITGLASIYTESYTPNMSGYDQLNYDNGSGVTFAVNFRGAESINDNIETTSLTINSSGSADIIDLGTNTFGALMGTATVDYLAGSKNSIIVSALNGSDLNISDNITLTGDLTITADRVTETGAPVISVDLLTFNNVNRAGTAGNRLSTNINSLALVNHSGSIFLSENNALDIASISNTPGNLDVVTLAGSITSASDLVINGALALDSAEGIFLTGNNQFLGATVFTAITDALFTGNALFGNTATVTANNNITFSGNITGTLPLSLTANNVLLAGNNQFSGASTFNAGNDITFQNLNEFNGTATVTAINNISFEDDVKTTATMNVTANDILLAGNNQFFGAATFEAGNDITFSNLNTFNESANLTAINNVRFEDDVESTTEMNITANDIVFVGNNQFSGATTFSASNDITFNNPNTFNGTANITSVNNVRFEGDVISAATINITANNIEWIGVNQFTNSTTMIASSDVIFNDITNFDGETSINADNTIRFDADVTATSDMTLVADNIVLEGANQFTGTNNFTAGTDITLNNVNVFGNSTLGNSTPSNSTAPVTTLIAMGNINVAQNLTALSSISFNATDITLSGINQFSGISDFTASNDATFDMANTFMGALTITATNTLNFTGSVIASDAATLAARDITLAVDNQFSGATNITATNDINLNGANNFLEVANLTAINNMTFIGNVISNSPFNLNGANITLMGQNQFLGTTTMTATDTVTLVDNNLFSDVANIVASNDIILSGDIRAFSEISLQANNINASGDNELAGDITLAGENIVLNNTLETNLASVAAQNLTLTSEGSITNTGSIVVKDASLTGVADLTSYSGSIVLEGDGNDFDVVIINALKGEGSINEMNGITVATANVAGALSITSNVGLVANDSAIGDMALGTLNAETITLNASEGAIVDQSSSLTATAIILTAATGIGQGGVNFIPGSGFAPSAIGAINTTTSSLNIINASSEGKEATTGEIHINNSGNLTVDNLLNYGDIVLNNSGNITLNLLDGSGAINANYGGLIDDSVYKGSVAITSNSSNNVTTMGVGFSEADIIAENFLVNSVVQFGQRDTPIRIRVNNQFTLFANQGSVYYIGARPRSITTSADLALLVIDGIAGLSGQQLIDIETLGEVDEAIFTEVRNYNYDDIAILLPVDQRYSSVNEDDEEEENENRRIKKMANNIISP